MFDLRSVSLAAGEQHCEDLSVTLADFTIGGEPYHAEPRVVPARLAITRLRAGWVFDEEFSARVVGACHRCLGQAAIEFAIEAQEYHALRPHPGMEEDETCEYLEDGAVLDTDRMAFDAVLLAMPLQVLCRDDCRGLCPLCGADLNVASCSCRSAA